MNSLSRKMNFIVRPTDECYQRSDGSQTKGELSNKETKKYRSKWLRFLPIQCCSVTMQIESLFADFGEMTNSCRDSEVPHESVHSLALGDVSKFIFVSSVLFVSTFNTFPTEWARTADTGSSLSMLSIIFFFH